MEFFKYIFKKYNKIKISGEYIYYDKKNDI